jgi:7-cyano-7-deazaguanine synthase
VKRTLVLLSGGMDSAVCLFQAVREHGAGEVEVLFFDWGQRTLSEELTACRALCEAAGTEAPDMIALDFPYQGALTDAGAEVPAGRTPEAMMGGVAPTFFPGRNIVMLAYAFGLAAARGHALIYFGPNADDAAGYPDCRAEFLAQFESACVLGTESDARLVTPLVGMTKEQVVSVGDGLGVPWALTFSCYAPVGGVPCGSCDSCVLRRLALGEEA